MPVFIAKLEALQGCFTDGHSLTTLGWITKSQAHGSTYKGFNVTVLCKAGNIWISKCLRWREERRIKSWGWFTSSKLMLISGILSRSAFLCPYSSVSRGTMWDPLWTCLRLCFPIRKMGAEWYRWSMLHAPCCHCDYVVFFSPFTISLKKSVLWTCFFVFNVY